MRVKHYNGINWIEWGSGVEWGGGRSDIKVMVLNAQYYRLTFCAEVTPSEIVFW